MTYEAIIGLEIHIQLKTKSKMFCSCDNSGENQPPNTTICPICLGHPGVLPVINKQAVEWSVLAALALNCRILSQTRFARKNYFYPDLPKGYQISMYEEPIAVDGKLIIDVPAKGKERRQAEIKITRVHLEEDAAKLLHAKIPLNPPFTKGEEDKIPLNPPFTKGEEGGISFVDFNRSGTPLLEIVTEPDLRSPLEAKVFMQELRRIVRYLGISDAEMEKGHLRCDANISLRPIAEKKDNQETYKSAIFHPKTEIKNLNSFKAVERALEYEFIRQKKMWEEGKPPVVLATRGWDETKAVTEEQRTKEESGDYRYFPEPDLPPLSLRELAKKISSHLPELPSAKRLRFIDEYELTSSDVLILTEDKEWADFTEATIAELKAWLGALESEEGTEAEVWNKHKKKLMKLLSGWLISKLFGLMEKHSINIKRLKITPENFAEFIALFFQKRISGPAGLQILEEMLLSGGDPSQIMEAKNLEQISSEEDLLGIAREIIEKNAKLAEEYTKGKENVLMFFVGQIMKATRGKANPGLATKILKKLLK